MEFAPDDKIRAIAPLVEEFSRHVLYDEPPLFISDEATLLDVSMASPEELAKRCAEYYKTSVSIEDLRRPLWQLLPDLESRRKGKER